MPRSINRVSLVCGLLTLAILAGGCQREAKWNLAPVEGTILRGGSPLAGIQVTFWPDVEAGTQGPRVSSSTDAAGHYVLHTDVAEPGAVVGHYRVCLLDTQYPSGDDMPKEANVKNVREKMSQFQVKPSGSSRVPLRYSHPNETPLRVEVRSEAQVINLEVK